MIVEKIVSIRTKKIIRWGNGVSMPQYISGLKKHGLEVIREGDEVDDEVYEELYQETVKRIKRRALYILSKQDKSENDIRKKLRENGYGDDFIDIAIDYLKGYHYVDDSRYASSYVRNQGKVRSKRDLKMKLLQKGVSKDDIETALDNEEYDEEEAIKSIIRRKHYDQELDDVCRAKAYRYLLSKGFDYELIDKYLKSIE